MSKRCLGCMEYYGDEFELCPHCGYVEGTPAEEAIHMPPGTLLYNRYIVGKVLGFGGFGVTYIGWDGKLEQKVAIKEYLPGEFSTRMPGQSAVTVFNGDKSEQFRDGLSKFVEEAKRLAKFQNEPGIVKVFDSFTENGTAYIVMEFLDGETLTERLKRDKTIPEDEAVNMLWPLMNSLQVVHQEGILHRDIAPDNVFLTKSGDVKLIDFGASRYATTSHSRSLTVIIKPGYSPEEQYRSRGDQGPHTDVYALAATLYKMMTGKTPPDAMERRAKVENQKKEILEEPHKLNKNISLNRENAILNAMNVRIEDRTPNVAAFMNELNAHPPVKRRYGKIKKIDLYAWPLWLKILVPALLSVFVAFGVLLMTGVIDFPSLFSDKVVVPEGFVVVPEVEGMDKDEALKLISETGLVASAKGNVESEYVDVGKIVLQTPIGGSYLGINGTVELTVSSGKGVVEVEDGIATVPYVVWKSQEEAIAMLKEAGLAEPVIQTQSDESVPAGQVISQSEEVGTKLPEGAQITLVVSTGPAAFDMPNVVGQTEDSARKTLEEKGLLVSFSYEKDSSVAEGKVLRQTVFPGTPVHRGDSVTVVVSTGKPVVKVPDVRGKTKTEAESLLKGKGFKVGYANPTYSTSVQKDSVISQSSTENKEYEEGATITLTLSKGPQPFTVTYDANGGSGTTTKTVYDGSSYGTLPSATRTGYTLKGWYTAKTGGSKVSTTTTVTRTHTLYAQWTANNYTVTYNANGGSVSTTSKQVTYNSTYGTLPTPTRTGYTFSGWYTAASGGTKITKDTKVTTNKNHNLYAHWQVLSYTYTVRYESTNGTFLGNGPSITREHGTVEKIYPNKDFPGYTTPSYKTITWDETDTAFVIRFKYTPTAVATSQQLISNAWWYQDPTYPTCGVKYSVKAEYRNRTANSVQVRLVWTQSIIKAAYEYNQYFYASMWHNGTNKGSTGDVTIAKSSKWYYSSSWHTDSVTVNSGWVTVSLSTTNATTVTVNCDWWGTNANSTTIANGSWNNKVVNIPAY